MSKGYKNSQYDPWDKSSFSLSSKVQQIQEKAEKYDEKFCCESFRKMIKSESYGAVFFEKFETQWKVNINENEYNGFKLDFCPFCGTKLPLRIMEKLPKENG